MTEEKQKRARENEYRRIERLKCNQQKFENSNMSKVEDFMKKRRQYQ